MSKYKIVFLDMDGTTLTSEHEFPAETVTAIDELRAKGVKVSLATGRGINELKDYESEKKHIDYGVIMSGGAVYDFAAGKALFTKPLPLDIALAVIDAGEAVDAMVHILTVYDAFARQEDIEHMDRFLMKTYQPMYERHCQRVADVDALRELVKKAPDEIIKINLYHRTPQTREISRRRLEHLPIAYAYAEQTSFEVSAQGINKAVGMEFLCQYLKIDKSEAVAFGDAPNDVEILQSAGLGVAMGNSSAEIKAIADDVTLTCDENGVLAALRKYFF